MVEYRLDGKYLLEKMDLVDPGYIEEADRLPRKKPILWKQWTALAACLAIAVISGIMTVLSTGSSPQTAESAGDTASIFSGSGVTLALMGLSLLAAAGIAAYIIKKKLK